LTIRPSADSRPAKKPSWLKVKFPSHANFFAVSSLLSRHSLNTICQSAKCPNIAECWTQKTATFLILGNTCSRNCAFCAVQKGSPAPVSADEPVQVAEAAKTLGLSYAVITSVTRDDLDDGGASQFVRCLQALRERIPGIKIETLIPDFGGGEEALKQVIEAAPDILSHNLETVEALYPHINRPRSNYGRSLAVLKKAKDLCIVTKSGLMIGLGETEDDLIRTFQDLRRAGCDLLTIGQYLQPTRAHAPVEKYYTPQEFDRWKEIALSVGFAGVESAPLVRSSFHAHRLYDKVVKTPKNPSCDT
jgi:lipoic acid synthetase